MKAIKKLPLLVSLSFKSLASSNHSEIMDNRYKWKVFFAIASLIFGGVTFAKEECIRNIIAERKEGVVKRPYTHDTNLSLPMNCSLRITARLGDRVKLDVVGKGNTLGSS